MRARDLAGGVALISLVGASNGCDGRVEGEARGGRGVDAGVDRLESDARGALGADGTVDAAPIPGACAVTPAQLIDFNALASQLGARGIGATQLAADATSLYFVFGGALLRLPLDGSPVSTLLKLGLEVGGNWDPVATSMAVVFHYPAATGADEYVFAVPKGGGTARTLATSNGRVLAFQANDSAVYFVDQSGLQSVPLTGGGGQALSNAVPLQAASGLAVVGSSVVVTTNGTVYSVPVGGGTPTTLATPWASASRGPQPNAVFPMACGSDICWWTGASNSLGGPTGPGFIARLAGGSVTTISAPVGPASLSFDGTDFFETVGCDLCTGTLYRVPASGGEMVIMAQGWYAVVEGAYVYFSVAGGFNLPSSYDGGVPGSGIYGIDKSCEPVQRDM